MTDDPWFIQTEIKINRFDQWLDRWLANGWYVLIKQDRWVRDDYLENDLDELRISFKLALAFFWNVVDGSRDIDDFLVGGEYVIHPTNRRNSYVQIK